MAYEYFNYNDRWEKILQEEAMKDVKEELLNEDSQGRIVDLGFEKLAAKNLQTLFGKVAYAVAEFLARNYGGSFTLFKKPITWAYIREVSDDEIERMQVIELPEGVYTVQYLAKEYPDIVKAVFAKSKDFEDIKIELSGFITKISKKKAAEEYSFIKFPNGWYWANLCSGNDEGEAKEMQHCGSDSRGGLYSLRDKNHHSHITLTYNKEENIVYQIKGKQNAQPDKKYWWALRKEKEGDPDGFFDKTEAFLKDLEIGNELKTFINPQSSNYDLMYERVKRFKGLQTLNVNISCRIDPEEGTKNYTLYFYFIARMYEEERDLFMKQVEDKLPLQTVEREERYKQGEHWIYFTFEYYPEAMLRLDWTKEKLNSFFDEWEKEVELTCNQIEEIIKGFS